MMTQKIHRVLSVSSKRKYQNVFIKKVCLSNSVQYYQDQMFFGIKENMKGTIS